MHDSYNLVVILLSNAKLPTSTFHNIVSLLVEIVKERSKEKGTNYEFHEEKFDILRNHLTKLKTSSGAYGLLLQAGIELTDGATIRTTSINTTLNTNIEEVYSINKETGRILGRDRRNYIIDLDDAVTAWKDIKSDF